MESFYHLVSVLLSMLVLFSYTCHPSLVHYPINNMQCIDSERDALLQFKHGLDRDYDGLLASWRPHTNCCQWRGVRCSNQTGHVIRLSLARGGQLVGKVSPSLGKLNHLKHLNLSSNSFYGELPHQLGNLSKLSTLDLNSCYENVKKISWISRLSMLRYLDLSHMDLSQVKNWMRIVSNLPSLRVLRMDRCLLHPIENPSSLSYLNFSASLHTISLSSNNFSGSSIFKWLSNIPRISTQLEYLDLSFNAFEIPIPSNLANFHTLSYLSLANNEFQGSVYKTISNLCNLRQLYLGNNHFADELVDVIQSIVNCENKELLTLDLSHNNISGTIPNSISSFSSLKELHLNDNKLKGEISQGIGELTMLEILDVSSNSLEGNLTHTFFSNLSHLRELDLSSNLRVEVKIGEDWIPPFQLDVVNLRSCNLGPHYPKWLRLQTINVSYLDVSDNGIFDTIPFSFWNSLSDNCNYLNMSHNQFYGVLSNPQSICLVIDLSSNLLEGVIPSAYAYVDTLQLNDNRFIDCSNILCPKFSVGLILLELSNNLFSGELPDCWSNLSQLRSLHLENNRFSGRIPKSMGTLSSLTYLHLYNNSFSGPFPSAFENCTSLDMLNLGYNLFTGYIPPWIGSNFGSLTSLILRKNHFIGEIHESICQISNLHILDLSGNHISGVIPNCIGNFTAMKIKLGLKRLYYAESLSNGFNTYEFIETETSILEWKREEHLYKETFRLVSYIDLSNNELSGEIPDGISNLTTLGALDLSKNKLSGNIPSSIGKMTALELLDLSNNLLTGEIPTSLAEVTTLGILDVSNNNLSGQIPVSTQLQSFDASSYAGNQGLCGMPLPSCSPSNVPNRGNTSGHGKDDNFGFFLGLYISVTLGFIVGFWGVCGTLVIKTSWRYAYFRFLDNIKDRVF